MIYAGFTHGLGLRHACSMSPALALLAIVVAAPSQGAVPGATAPAALQAGEASLPLRERLIRAWEGPLAERVEELVRDGQEDAVLAPLARYPVAARFMLGYFRRSDRLLQRKLAPSLARLLGKDAPAATLDELFEAEATRRADALHGETTGGGGDNRMNAVNRVIEKSAGRPGFAGFYDAQSVVEDVVIAARSWCGEPSRAMAAAAVLRKVVERTIAGERWNSVGRAMEELVCDCHQESRELLTRFETFAFAVPPYGSPLPMDIEARKVIEELRAGRCDEPRRSAAESSADPLADWSRSDRDELRAFLRMAGSVR